MDWARAKSILICIFIALNIFLLITISKFYFRDNPSEETIVNAINALKSRGVIVKTEIPRYNEKVGKLSYYDSTCEKNNIIYNFFGENKNLTRTRVGNTEEVIFDNKKIIFDDSGKLRYEDINPKSSINTSDKFSVLKQIEKIVKNFNIPFEKFYEDEYTRNNDSATDVILILKYKNFFVFDNYVKAEATDKGITYLEIKYRDVKGITSKKKILPIYQVLLKNFKGANNGSVIEGIDIGFKENILELGTKETNDIPAWRIRIEKGKCRYFKAYTGEEIM